MDGTVRVWDLAGGRCIAVLEGHTGGVRSVAVTADGQRAASVSMDGTVRVWDLAGGRCIAVLEGHAGWVNGVAVTADGRAAVSRSNDQTVRVWDLVGGRCIATFDDESEAARKAWATAHHRLVGLGHESYGLTLRTLAQGEVLARFPGSFSMADCSVDGHIVACDSRGAVYLLRLHTRHG
jgi:WD40 repeat protein